MEGWNTGTMERCCFPLFIPLLQYSTLQSSRRHERIAQPVGIAHGPQVERPGGTTILQITHTAIHKSKIGTSRVTAFVQDGMAAVLDPIRIVASLALEHVHKVVARAERVAGSRLRYIF